MCKAYGWFDLNHRISRISHFFPSAFNCHNVRHQYLILFTHLFIWKLWKLVVLKIISKSLFPIILSNSSEAWMIYFAICLEPKKWINSTFLSFGCLRFTTPFNDKQTITFLLLLIIIILHNFWQAVNHTSKVDRNSSITMKASIFLDFCHNDNWQEGNIQVSVRSWS